MAGPSLSEGEVVPNADETSSAWDTGRGHCPDSVSAVDASVGLAFVKKNCWKKEDQAIISAGLDRS